MISLFSLCLLLFSSKTATAEDTIYCGARMEMVPPQNITTPVYYPSDWNEGLVPPPYQTNQQCKWIVWIPDNMYVWFTMMADIGGDSTLKITDCNGKSETIMTSQLNPYVFIGGNFTIDLNVGPTWNSTSFGFSLMWNNYPTRNPTFFNVSKSSEALVFDDVLHENTVVLTAETRVSLVAFPAAFADLTSYLRLTLVFDGPDLNSPLLGTLFQAVRANKPIVSSGNKMTVFTFQDYFLVGAFFVVQDYYNIQNLVDTKGITCWSQSSCPVTLNAANGPVSAMTLNEDDWNEYLKKLDLSADAELKVYIGARREDDDSNLITSYNAKQCATNIPQKFYGDLMTYYLESGTALLELAQDMNFTRWNDAFPGRQGFISSKYYSGSELDQDTFEHIGGKNASDVFSFHVNVTHVDISNDAYLTVFFGSETGTTYHQFSMANPNENTAFAVAANNMSVHYTTNGVANTTGFFLHFEIDQVQSGAAKWSCLLSVAVLLLLIL